MDEFELEEGPVSGEDLIGEIANLYPETQEFLMSLGMHCLGCAAAASETLAEACRVHGLSTFKVKRELNRIITARLQDQVGQSEIIPPANCNERIFEGVD